MSLVDTTEFFPWSRLDGRWSQYCKCNVKYGTFTGKNIFTKRREWVYLKDFLGRDTVSNLARSKYKNKNGKSKYVVLCSM